MLTSRKSTPQTACGRPFPAGGGKKAVRAGFAVLAVDSESSSDEEVTPTAPQCPPQVGAGCSHAARIEVKVLSAAPVSLRNSLAVDAEYQALSRMDILWGDLMTTEADVAAMVERARALPAPAPVTPPAPFDAEAAEEELWSQPFAANLSVWWADTYDTRKLTNTEFHDMLSWLYERGWRVESHDRNGVQAFPDNLPSRRYIAVSFVEAEAEAEGHGHCCGSKAAHTARVKAPVVIPRFCRAGAECADTACRYVHGDTIPKTNKPCGFGAECGASDPTGKKRSQCIYIHPGEEWNADLVIRRL